MEPNSDGGNEAEQKWDRLGWPRYKRLNPDNGVIISILLEDIGDDGPQEINYSHCATTFSTKVARKSTFVHAELQIAVHSAHHDAGHLPLITRFAVEDEADYYCLFYTCCPRQDIEI